MEHQYWSYDITAPAPIPPKAKADAEDKLRRIEGLRIHVKGGEIWRDETSRILARIEWDAPHETILAFGRSKGLMNQTYVCLETDISTSPEKLTTFEVVGSIGIASGDTMFNIATWKAEQTPIPGEMSYRGQALGWLDGQILRAEYESEHTFRTTYMPGFEMIVRLAGTLEVAIEVS